MSEITHLIVLRLVESLQFHLIDDVTSSDPARANLIKSYRFQADPTDTPITFSVSSGNPEDPNFIDGRIGIGQESMEDLNIRVPSGEVGGGHLWWRRGRVIASCNFTSEGFDQETAADVAKTAFGRAAYWTENTYVADLFDDYGERALQVFVYATKFNEGGGPDNQYLWRGQILWQVLTERPI
jgi:hypothetical protein